MEEQVVENAVQESPAKKRLKLSMLKKPGKHMFWAWIAYQCIKGTTTTSLIWAPMFYYWWTHHS